MENLIALGGFLVMVAMLLKLVFSLIQVEPRPIDEDRANEELAQGRKFHFDGHLWAKDKHGRWLGYGFNHFIFPEDEGP